MPHGLEICSASRGAALNVCRSCASASMQDPFGPAASCDVVAFLIMTMLALAYTQHGSPIVCQFLFPSAYALFFKC